MNQKYISHFLSLDAARDLIPFFTGCRRIAAKEITESWGCYEAAKRIYHFDDDTKNKLPDLEVIVVGDGVRPRTASLFAFLTRANCHSIDPMLNLNWFDKYNRECIPTKRLQIFREKGQDVTIDCKNKDCLMIFPHSHCSLNVIKKIPTNYKSLNIISMPCCVKLKDEEKNVASEIYKDEEVWSPKNIVYIWKGEELIKAVK